MVFLVNAVHVKQVPGCKTDKAGARWLAKLMRYGLLQASFIPPAGQRDLRDLTRYRTKLVQERGREVNRVQGVLERDNIKLAAVATNIFGVSEPRMNRGGVIVCDDYGFRPCPSASHLPNHLMLI